MSATAVVTLSPQTAFSDQSIVATCTVTNNGATAINVNAVNPIVTVFGGTAQNTGLNVGIPQVGGAFPSQVPASGTLAIPFGVVGRFVNTNNPELGVGQNVYSIGAEVLLSDGEDIFALSAPFIIVSSLPTPLQFGQLIFSNLSNSGLLPLVGM